MRTVCLFIVSASAVLLVACAVVVFFPSALGLLAPRALPAATAVLSVNVDNPDVPAQPPVDTGGGGGSPGGGSGGSSGGSDATPPATPAPLPKSPLQGDINGDGMVNLSDFSILAYWYKRPLTSAARGVDLNNDGRVDLVDFSILAYYWNR